jgi:hypothetical protein
MTGGPYIVRLLLGVSKPKIKQLGVDVAGQVEAVGGNVTNSSTPKTRIGWFCTSGTELDACPLAHWESFCAFRLVVRQQGTNFRTKLRACQGDDTMMASRHRHVVPQPLCDIRKILLVRS